MSVAHLDPGTTALVLIDLQQGIVAMPAEPHTTGEVIANAVRLAGAFRFAGAPVVLVHVVASPGGGDSLRPEVDEPRQVRQTPPGFAAIVPELSTGDRDIVIAKRQWGAFYGTDLDLQLRRRGVRTIVIGGISTNYGVESTARDAFERNYGLVFVEDAMSARSAEDHAFAMARVFPRIGRVASTSDVLTALGDCREEMG
jgi:nicotinamidase-related amidase